MTANIAELRRILEVADKYHAQVVAVSKTKPVEEILALYEAGHRIFGENYVQELLEKQQSLPVDIRWHFIGHLQSNKVKYIASFVHMIHSVDNGRLLKEISKQAQKTGRVIDCLLQVHIAKEETKFGLDEAELIRLLEDVIIHPESYGHIRLRGLMGMATNTPDKDQVREEFHFLKTLFNKMLEKYISHPQHFTEISMGMSGDYTLALEEGSTLLRIGSLLFGERTYGPA